MIAINVQEKKVMEKDTTVGNLQKTIAIEGTTVVITTAHPQEILNVATEVAAETEINNNLNPKSNQPSKPKKNSNLANSEQ